MSYFKKLATRCVYLAVLFGCVISIVPATAESPFSAYQERKKQANESVVTIMGSGTASPYTRLAEDIQNVVDEPNVPGGLRVLPILGRGGAQNAIDVLLLKGVDMGVVEADDISQARVKDPAVFANVEQRIHYITKLANSEFQVLARREIKTFADLEGRKVNFFKKLSSTEIACNAVFKAAQINVVPTYYDQEEAGARLRSGDIDAMVRYAGAPHNAFSGFKGDDGFHFLSIDADSVGAERYSELLKTYSPALLKNEYYPQLIANDRPVPTIAGSMLLVVYNWPVNSERYTRVAKFVAKFFDNIAKFQGPGRHPKWKEINIAYEVPGWTRFKAAQQWLDGHKEADASTGGRVKTDFDTFLKTRQVAGTAISKEEREALFQQFMAWYSKKK
ncbi:hypothetical protein Rvan_0384 [Rhodomicrobium vannielii ATCC 17100]|uniref:TRAP transporter solute receptor, TAXI family n=2 Tax=Rhodomicrobium vannielii TaxID=1069 RepID=E3I7Q4_RHOVT|nr:hypothetical protein Rvan_0384 [Rhodomicrobium vannielii ATCC 17100]